MTDQEKETKIKALMKERAGYELHGKLERAAEVDVELKKLGVEGSAPAKRSSKRVAQEVN